MSREIFMGTGSIQTSVVWPISYFVLQIRHYAARCRMFGLCFCQVAFDRKVGGDAIQTEAKHKEI